MPDLDRTSDDLRSWSGTHMSTFLWHSELKRINRLLSPGRNSFSIHSRKKKRNKLKQVIISRQTKQTQVLCSLTAVEMNDLLWCSSLHITEWSECILKQIKGLFTQLMSSIKQKSTVIKFHEEFTKTQVACFLCITLPENIKNDDALQFFSPDDKLKASADIHQHVFGTRRHNYHHSMYCAREPAKQMDRSVLSYCHPGFIDSFTGSLNAVTGK